MAALKTLSTEPLPGNFFFVLLEGRSVNPPIGRVTKTEAAFTGQGPSLQAPSLRLQPQFLQQKQLEFELIT